MTKILNKISNFLLNYLQSFVDFVPQLEHDFSVLPPQFEHDFISLLEQDFVGCGAHFSLPPHDLVLRPPLVMSLFFSFEQFEQPFSLLQQLPFSFLFLPNILSPFM